MNTKITVTVMTITLLSLFFATFGTATHTPLGESNHAHTAQDQDIVANQQDVDDLQSDVDQLDADITDLRDRVARDEQLGLQYVSDLQSSIDSLDTRVAQLNADHVSQTDVQTLRDDLTQVETEFNAAKAQVTQRLDDLEQHATDAANHAETNANAYTDSEVGALRGDMQAAKQQLDSDIDALQTDLTTLRERVARDEQLGLQALNRIQQEATQINQRLSNLDTDKASRSELASLHEQLGVLRSQFQTEKHRVITQLENYSDTNDRRVLTTAQRYADANDQDTTDVLSFDGFLAYVNQHFDALVTRLDDVFATDDRVAALEAQVAQQDAQIAYLQQVTNHTGVDVTTAAQIMAANNLSEFTYGETTCDVYTNVRGEKKVRCVH